MVYGSAVLRMLGAAVALLAANVSLLPAQSTLRVVGEIGVGYGAGNGGVYRTREGLDRHVSLAVHRSMRPGWALFVEGLVLSAVDTGEQADCIFTPRGCLRDYPKFRGPAITTGAVRTIGNAFQLRLGVGLGALAYDGTRVGATVGQLDLTTLVAPHLGIVYGLRRTWVNNYRGDRLSRTVGSLGVRVR